MSPAVIVAVALENGGRHTALLGSIVPGPPVRLEVLFGSRTNTIVARPDQSEGRSLRRPKAEAPCPPTSGPTAPDVPRGARWIWASISPRVVRLDTSAFGPGLLEQELPQRVRLGCSLGHRQRAHRIPPLTPPEAREKGDTRSVPLAAGNAHTP